MNGRGLPAQAGFTLIEALIYLALFSIMVGGLAESAYGLFESADRDRAKAMLQEEESFIVGKIDWTLENASAVSLPAQNASGNSLSVIASGSETTIALSGTNVLFNGAVLNNSNVTITNLVFIHTYASGTNPESVEAGFTIATKTSAGAAITESASTTDYIQK